MASLTDRVTEVTAALVELLEAEKGTLGLREVFDGDRQLIGETPAVAIMSGPKNRELYAAPVMTKVEFQVVFLLYHHRLQSVAKSEREVIELSEAVEEVLHRKPNQTLSGLVIFGMVTRVEPGYANREGSILRTTRLTWEAQSRHLLPTS